jgi:hypothetical protein
MFTKTSNWTLFSIWWIQSISVNPISIHFNIVLPPTPRSSKWTLSFVFCMLRNCFSYKRKSYQQVKDFKWQCRPAKRLLVSCFSVGIQVKIQNILWGIRVCIKSFNMCNNESRELCNFIFEHVLKNHKTKMTPYFKGLHGHIHYILNYSPQKLSKYLWRKRPGRKVMMCACVTLLFLSAEHWSSVQTYLSHEFVTFRRSADRFSFVSKLFLLFYNSSIVIKYVS